MRCASALLSAVQVHYDSELGVLDEYIGRIGRSSIVSNAGGSTSTSVFESQLERTSAALGGSIPEVLLHMQAQVFTM
jgi:hypothetical protein